ncbi:MAG: hypothetical protein QXM69_10085 [Sulfolobaceae archaeon]
MAISIIIQIRRFKFCKNCYSINSWNSTSCRFCKGSELITDFEPKSWLCVNCGSVNGIGALEIEMIYLECRSCGFRPILYVVDIY